LTGDLHLASNRKVRKRRERNFGSWEEEMSLGGQTGNLGGSNQTRTGPEKKRVKAIRNIGKKGEEKKKPRGKNGKWDARAGPGRDLP